MEKTLSYFDTSYDPSAWPCGTQYLSKAYLQLRHDKNATVTMLPPHSFYPISWQVTLQFHVVLL
jgi:hypothetical protein